MPGEVGDKEFTGWWQKHTEVLLNPAKTSYSKEPQPENSREVSTITLAEFL